MEPKPTKSCLNCGPNNWWRREAFGPGVWLCGTCHPNPNKEEVVEQEVELVGSKFVVKGENKEVKREEWKPEPKQYNEEVIALKDRVINGNQKLFDAWLKIREFAHNSTEWARQMDRWAEAQKRLQGLCSQLKLRGYEDCLYFKEGKRTKSCLDNPDGFWCQVCPSTYPHWEKELSNL